ncbi:uncharacterized protein NPIL_442611 [Nephila pilipes]|uniref:Uncharacterized protein n=1 Tax=Nephila pilipes TaxID=299642 RepID=A0A8X6IA55_NEPPI|nr:uncharacterized protein NPIL_442611 [Nephila pilipes]
MTVKEILSIHDVYYPKDTKAYCVPLDIKLPAVPNQETPPYESVKEFYGKKKFKNKVFSFAYLTMVLLMVSFIISLYVYMESKQLKMENTIAFNVVKCNVTGMKYIENIEGKEITSQAKIDSTEEYHLRKGYLLTMTYQIDDQDEVLKYVCTISAVLLILSVICFPFVIYCHVEKANEIYRDNDRDFKVMEINFPDSI